MRATTAKKLLSSGFLLFALLTQSLSQQDPIDALKKLYDDYPQEKIYLWFNKPAYVAGETTWFKAYVFSGYDMSFISTTLYVELYNAEKKLISTKLLPLVSGVTEGSIDLENKLEEGVYYVRAYTDLMLNFNEAFQYIHTIPVYNPASVKHLSLNRSIWKAGAFPEGGSLINGVDTKIAIRRYSTVLLEDRWGGFLYEEANPTVKIKEFTSLDENAGLLTFTPETGKKYYVSVEDEHGNRQICPLPFVSSSGVSISIEDISDSITYKLQFTNLAGNGNGYTVIGQIQHQFVYKANLKKTPSEISMKISATGMNNGILHLTVFDSANQPVAERLVFVNPLKLNYDSTVVSHSIFSGQLRSKSSLELKEDSVNWISYGVSVSDASASSLPEENILSALWLTTDLLNPLQNPASYFRQPGKNKMNALDAIMISEKWMRFEWNEILNNKYPIINHIPFNYLSYTGKVTKGNKLKTKDEVTLILYYPDSSTRIVLSQTDSLGNIVLDNLAFYEELKVFYQLNNKKYAARLIDIAFQRDNRFFPYSLALPQTPYTLVSTVSNSTPAWVSNTVSTLKMQKAIDEKYKPLKEVVVEAKLKTNKEQLDEKLSSGLFKNIMGETIFDFVNENQNAIAYTNILQWLEGRVAGLSVQRQNGEYVPYIRGSRASLYIDEMRADPGMVESISVSDIAMIKVIKGPFALVLGGGSGVIAIYTLRGNMRPAEKEPSLPNNKIKGYDSVKKIFLPDYEDQSIPQPDNDLRDQLLWQTSIVPIMANKSTVSFFNNDNAKKIRIVVQGFTETGFPVYSEKTVGVATKAF